MAPAVLKDISGHWAEASIRRIMEAGVVSGYGDQSFQPDKRITRAEFTVMLVKALKLPAQKDKIFVDTAGNWVQ